MDFEKMKQWMDIAQQMHGDDFWNLSLRIRTFTLNHCMWTKLTTI